jgi:hypothetical protein
MSALTTERAVTPYTGIITHLDVETHKRALYRRGRASDIFWSVVGFIFWAIVSLVKYCVVKPVSTTIHGEKKRAANAQRKRINRKIHRVQKVAYRRYRRGYQSTGEIKISVADAKRVSRYGMILCDSRNHLIHSPVKINFLDMKGIDPTGEFFVRMTSWDERYSPLLACRLSPPEN